jgi:hypothetical protein
VRLPARYTYFTEGDAPIIRTVEDRTGESGSPRKGETVLISGQRWIVERVVSEMKSERGKPLVICYVFLQPAPPSTRSQRDPMPK